MAPELYVIGGAAVATSKTATNLALCFHLNDMKEIHLNEEYLETCGVIARGGNGDSVGIVPSNKEVWEDGMPGALTDGNANGTLDIIVTGAAVA